jgi:integrase
MKNRNAKGGGSVRQREDGTWEARCTINGKRRSFYGKKQSEVVKAMRAALSAADAGTFVEPSKMTVEQWLFTWLEEYARPSVKPLTYSAYRTSINTHIIPGIGSVKLTALNPTQVQTFYNDLLRKKQLSPKTIKNTHGILHKALEQAQKLRYINANVTDMCTVPRVEKTEIKPLTEDEIAMFIECAREDEYADILIVALFTGMRRGELCGLSWDAIDLKRGTISVKQQLCASREDYSYYIASTKSDRIRTLKAPKFVIDIFSRIKKEQASRRLKCGFLWQDKNNLVFTSPTGKHIVPVTLYAHFKRIAEKIGREDARLHDLRHTYAVTALQEGDDVKTVQQNLGHATASFTLDVYGHVSERMKQESADRMERFYNKVNNG